MHLVRRVWRFMQDEAEKKAAASLKAAQEATAAREEAASRLTEALAADDAARKRLAELQTQAQARLGEVEGEEKAVARLVEERQTLSTEIEVRGTGEPPARGGAWRQGKGRGQPKTQCSTVGLAWPHARASLGQLQPAARLPTMSVRPLFVSP